VSWEDDLIMTNVRSFDVKAYDNAFAGYADLGWADDLRLWLPYQGLANFISPTAPPGISSTPPLTVWPPLSVGGVPYNTLTQTLAHEGRMPPLTTDLVFDAQWGPVGQAAVNLGIPSYLPLNSPFLIENKGNYNDGNVGDNTAGVVRLRRVWDSWSTDYSVAPSEALNTFPVGNAQLQGPKTGYPPVYPSYPAPYQAPLRGIQIQIRVADPANQRIKSLTIRQDFTDKL
jgi:hypothetical protein